MQDNNNLSPLRSGRFTGSQIEALCKPKGLGATGETYIYEVICEALTPPEMRPKSFENDATRWGHEQEPIAVKVHELRSKSMTEEIGFQIHPELDCLGATPDRKVYRNGKHGVLEVKCPYEGTNHIKHMMIDSVEYFKSNFPKYYWQTVCEFICTPDAEFVDFVSFDPRLSKKYRYFCFTFTPSEEDCKLIIERVKIAEKLKNEILNKLNR